MSMSGSDPEMGHIKFHANQTNMPSFYMSVSVG